MQTTFDGNRVEMVIDFFSVAEGDRADKVVLPVSWVAKSHQRRLGSIGVQLSSTATRSGMIVHVHCEECRSCYASPLLRIVDEELVWW